MHRVLPLLALASLLLSHSSPAGPISVGKTRVENGYPESITFEAAVASTAGLLSRVELHVRVRGDSMTSVIVAPIEPAASLPTRAEWKTRANDFQDLVADLLKAMGYHVSWVALRGKDVGVDIIAHTDPLGANPPRIKIQAKRTEEAAKVEAVRAFMSRLGDDDVGIFVCRGGFTKDAADEAREQEKRKVTLIDEGRLFDLWVERYDKLTQEARDWMPTRPIYFLPPGE